MAEAAVNPIVDIISRLWPCCARHTRYLCKLQENMNSLRNAMTELKEARDDVQSRVVAAEADLNEPKKRTDSVSGWLQRVQIIEREVEEILQKADEQLRRARSCLGVCCPPNNCWSNYKVGKSIAKKIPFVDVLKGKGGDFQELTYVARPTTNYLSKLQDNKILLRRAMAELKEARDDVQRRVVAAEADPNEPKKRTDSVSGWLQRVETIEGEVKVILQTSDEQLSNAECHEKDKLVVMKKAYVDELKVKAGDFQDLTYRLPPPSVQDMNLESTVGMESMFDKVWRLVVTNTDDDKQPVVRIMGIYGHGGVGKTTLLKKINNEFSKISGHDVVIFVVVSKPIDYKAIQKKIGEKLGLSFYERDDESSRTDKIFNQLKKKNFVILLDDIWERVDLERIGIPPQGNSSKIVIFTTRDKQVCGLMEATHKFQVKCLPWDKAWSLFQEKVGEEALTCFPTARELAKDVAKECGGLPLALITIGRAMSTKKSVQEWRDTIATLKNSASEFPGMSDDILPRLKLSYDNLHNETEKSCFLYCALFPEDHSIEIDKLVELWIAEGFLDGFDKLDEARNRGHTIIGSLKSACLLESSRGEDHVKMHDVIRDLALWIVNDCKSSSSSSSRTGKFLVASNNVCERWRNAERIFWNTDGYSFELEEPPPPPSPNLRTLLLHLKHSGILVNYPLPQRFFQSTPSLRVLDMSRTKIKELPTSICELHELQYLNLSRTGIKELPTSICELHELQYLTLSDTPIKELPTSICELHELQYLNLSRTRIKELPIELRKLVKLKFLDLMETYELEKIPPGVIANLSELQVLKLDRSGFKDWGSKEEDGGLSLGELDRLKQLQEITLTISTSLALEELLCNQKLRRICTYLRLKICVNLKSISLLPPSSTTSKGLGNLTSLKYLYIHGCVELEELILFINDGGGETNTTTTTSAAGLSISNNNKLEQLHLFYLPRLNNIVWRDKCHHYMAAAQQQQHYASPFQNLYSIKVDSCGALKDLTWVVYVENLEHLFVHNCKRLETIIELGDDGLEEGASGGGRVFRGLKTLEMWVLPNLKSICSHALVFPSIRTITIRGCPELKKLPLDSCSNSNNTLQWIRGKPEWWDELQWEDETIESKFLPYYRKGR